MATELCGLVLLLDSAVLAVCLWLWRRRRWKCHDVINPSSLLPETVQTCQDGTSDGAAYDVIICMGRLGLVVIYFLLCDRYYFNCLAPGAGTAGETVTNQARADSVVSLLADQTSRLHCVLQPVRLF